MVGLAQTFQCCQDPGWEHAAPLCSWALGLLLTCRREFARPPRSGISHGCSNACTAWGTGRSGFSVSVWGLCLEKKKEALKYQLPISFVDSQLIYASYLREKKPQASSHLELNFHVHGIANSLQDWETGRGEAEERHAAVTAGTHFPRANDIKLWPVVNNNH